MIEIPAGFAADTIQREGAAGREFIDALPETMRTYLDRWALTPAGAFLNGMLGVVLPVRRADGQRAALKLSWLDRGNSYEVAALRAWDGSGAARLLEADEQAGAHAMALLLEWLDPARSLETLPDLDRATELAATVVRELSVPPPPGVRFASAGTDEAQRWVEELPRDWALRGEPVPRRVLDVAVESCRQFATDQPDLLLHGDAHYANILAGTREPWVAIDPKGLVGEPAYESITVLWNRRPELAVAPDLGAAIQHRLTIWSQAAGVDRDRARRWAQARAVDEVLWRREYGFAADELAEYLAVHLAA